MSEWDEPARTADGEGEGDLGAAVDDAGGGAAGRSRGAVLGTVLVVLAVVGFLVVVLATREPAANRIADSPLVGRPAPAFSGTTLEGGGFELADESGRWVLVNFFATWCAPCRQEHDDLVAFDDRHRTLGDAGVVSVVFNDDLADARAFFEENGGNFPVVISDEGDIALDYGVAKVPESYLVAPDGTIVAKILGGVTAQGLEDILARFTGAGP